MGEVDELHHPDDEHEAECDQREQQSETQTVQEMGDDVGHDDDADRDTSTLHADRGTGRRRLTWRGAGGTERDDYISYVGVSSSDSIMQAASAPVSRISSGPDWLRTLNMSSGSWVP